MTLRLTDDEAEALRRRAQLESRSMQDVARQALDLGFYISFSGILTFKSAQDIRDVASWVPLNRLLIETDSPYLAPAPFRGKTNDPSLVPWVAKQLAELKGVDQVRMGEVAFENTLRLFKKIPALL